MGGCRCSYKNCRNTTKTTENIHFFHYPVKHKERCMIWIENANKPKFYELEEEQLRNKVICEVHFEDRWFPNSQKKRLIQGAVPTLDGDCEDDVQPSDQPNYIPVAHRSSDVQVLPANDDATVFVLDTENIFSTSKKVESYVYKNGILLPCNSQGQTKPRTLNRSLNSRPSTSNTQQYPGVDYETANSSMKAAADEDGEYKEVVVKKEMEENPGRGAEEGYEAFHEGGQGAAGRRAEGGGGPAAAAGTASAPSRALVNRSYLRKIKQHSRDIATIKRLLRQKMEVDRAERERERPLSVRTALAALQQHVPPSLYTVVSLLLGEKNELNDEDIEFFTTIHRTSPEVYQLLSDKYKWNLPSVDVVDMPSE